ncbi:MAG: DJ-1/PfpI family protein [Bacillota bacterium]|nr:DJ-1/PfpI family protein [Bacillota bacterium]
MQNKYCMLLGNNFDDIEGITVINILRRSDISLDIFSVSQNTVSSFTGMTYLINNVFNFLEDISTEEYDGILLPGGRGVLELAKNTEVISLVRKFYDEGKLVFGICGAPIILDKAGALDGKKYTCLPSVVSMIHSGNCIDEKVVVDSNVVTSKALGTSMDAALKLVEVIKSKEKAMVTADRYYIERKT